MVGLEMEELIDESLLTQAKLHGATHYVKDYGITYFGKKVGDSWYFINFQIFQPPKWLKCDEKTQLKSELEMKPINYSWEQL